GACPPAQGLGIGLAFQRAKRCCQGAGQKHMTARQATYARVVPGAPALPCPHVIHCALWHARLDLDSSRRSAATAPCLPGPTIPFPEGAVERQAQEQSHAPDCTGCACWPSLEAREVVGDNRNLRGQGSSSENVAITRPSVPHTGSEFDTFFSVHHARLMRWPSS